MLGAAESGVGAAILGKRKGFDVFVSDKGKIAEKYKSGLVKEGIAFEEEKHSFEKLKDATTVVKSPGIPDKVELIKKLKGKGIEIISEIEFASRYTNATIVGITGTNGKTTTTLLTYHILKKAGLNVGLGGNVGHSFAKLVADNNFDYYVLELSSFMLDGMFDARVNVAILTNITPDHLDRYEYNLDNYINSKLRITQNQTSEDSFIYCFDDPIIKESLKKHKFSSKALPFSIKETIAEGAFANEQELIVNLNKNQQLSMAINNLSLVGKHNLYNSMASAIAAKVLNIRKEVIRESLSDFENVEHRLEFVARVHGIDFINDSKATNVNSTWYALESMTKPTVWIVGGTDKGNDYESLKELVKAKVKAIVCLGVDNTKIIKAFADLNIPTVETKSAEEAVARSYKMAKNEDVVLLSPACASFDLFENYEDRGNQFKVSVRGL